MKKPDLLELLWEKIGCPYLSDLPTSPYRERAIEILQEKDLTPYSTRELKNLCEYLSLDAALLQKSPSDP